MRQRGKRSAARLVTLPAVDGRPPRLAAPRYLSKAEREIFAELVSTCDARAFSVSDMPLLAAYAQAVRMSRAAARDPAKIATWERATRAMAMLATKLRLSPQARTDPKTAGRRQPENDGPMPWEK